MTRKDYRIIAAAIRNAAEREGSNQATINAVVDDLTDVLWRDNPRFAGDRFAAACCPF